VKPWIGAAAVATALLVVPPAALAGSEDPAQIKFKLPSANAVHDFERLGLNMDHWMDRQPDGTAIVSAWATDEQVELARAHGYEPVGVIADKFAIDRIRAERAETLAKLKRAKDALRGVKVKPKSKDAAPGDIHAQRADLWENNVGRFLSIEANAEGAHYTGTGTNTYVGPLVTAEWYDADGNRLGGGNIGVYSDPDVNPRYYQYHYSVFRIGNVGDDAPVPAKVRIASSNGSVDEIDVREWIAKDPPKPAQGFQSGFVTHYNDSYEAYKKMRDLAAEFPNISEAIKLPEQTRGYQRKAQTMLGYTNTNQNPPNATTPYIRFDDDGLPLAGSSPTAAQQASTVVLTSKAYGHMGGNSLFAQIMDPAGAVNQPLSVTLAGATIRINPATDEDGQITSTAAQVVEAINNHPVVSTVVTASRWRTNAGNGVVQPGPRSPLSDLLRAPLNIPRGPQDQWMLRVGKDRDGSKVGVFLYCQEHGNEIATSGVCLETAERLVRNYGTDAETTELVDNLDIFILPMVNGDGAIHSLYDSNRRKNLSNHCEDTTRFPNNDTDPAQRNSWGVDLNRNFADGSVFDGFQGASATNCLSGNFAGLFEHSEPEVRNETWVQTTFRNIKFANNIHSSGGYFMWPPGAYTPQRVPMPYPPYGTLNFFDQTAKSVLDHIKGHRGTGILPQRTGPVIDVLYSAAGNSADEAWYSNGIIGFDFEIGTTNYYVNPDTGQETTCNAGQQPPFGPSSNPCLANEGFHEAMEFASGNYGLLKEALRYARDTEAPVVTATGDAVSNQPQKVRFISNEAASIYYTTDGSTPTLESTEWVPPRARALPLPVEITESTTLRWIAKDYKGNVSGVSSKTFLIETIAPTITLTGFSEGQVFTQGRPVPISYSCEDEGGSGLASCVGTQPSGSNLDTSTPGTFTFTVTATDNAGNQTVLERTYTVIPAVNEDGTVSGSVPATLAIILGDQPNFGAIVPGVAQTYTASTTANIISTAGDAALTVSDGSSFATGHLVNGTFSMPEPLFIKATNAATPTASFQTIGGSADPTSLLSWTSPISNDVVTLDFSQDVKANDALRTGTYSKALTFTLSTTNP
jgi:hypothetical protein